VPPCVIEPMRNLAITDQGSEQASSQAIPNQGCWPRLAERPERGSELGTEKLRLFPRGEVSALVDLVEVDQVAIGPPGPCLRGSIALPRKAHDGHRERDRGRPLRGRKSWAASASLPVEPAPRGRVVRQPVQRDVVEHLVWGFFGIAAAVRQRSDDQRQGDRQCRSKLIF